MSVPGAEDMRSRFRHATHSIFRLETLQAYGNSGEDTDFAAFRRGETPPLDTAGWYVSTVRAQTSLGVPWRRVHVVHEPHTDYMEFELVGYASNVAAGEDVRIIASTGETWPPGVPRDLDFWLVDERERFDMSYSSDGVWLGVHPTSDPSALHEACAIRDAALAHSVPWAEYMQHRHLDLWQRVPDAAFAGL